MFVNEEKSNYLLGNVNFLKKNILKIQNNIFENSFQKTKPVSKRDIFLFTNIQTNVFHYTSFDN